MEICPHCLKEFDNEKKYIFCPHCRRTPRTVEDCAKAVLQYVDTQELHKRASAEYWKTIKIGINQLIMDRKTSLEGSNMLFQTPLEASSDLLDI